MHPIYNLEMTATTHFIFNDILSAFYNQIYFTYIVVNTKKLYSHNICIKHMNCLIIPYLYNTHFVPHVHKCFKSQIVYIRLQTHMLKLLHKRSQALVKLLSFY